MRASCRISSKYSSTCSARPADLTIDSGSSGHKIFACSDISPGLSSAGTSAANLWLTRTALVRIQRLGMASKSLLQVKHVGIIWRTIEYKSKDVHDTIV